MRENSFIGKKENALKYKKTLIITTLFALCITFFVVFHATIFKIEEVEITGLEWVQKDAIIHLISLDESLLSLNTKALVKKIMDLNYIDEVLISRKLLKGLSIQIKEKSIVAQIIFKDKKYYLTAKNEILTEKSYILPKKIPIVFLQNNVENSQLMGISACLERMKFYDKNFFSKINQISFDEQEDANIFIMDSKKNYILRKTLHLEDLLRVRYLEGQKLNYGVFDLRGSYVVVKG